MLEAFIQKRLIALQGKMVKKVLNEYVADYNKKEPIPLTKNQTDVIESILTAQAERTSIIGDYSIIQERIWRANVTFLISATVGLGITLGTATFPLTAPFTPIIAPLMSAFVAWAIQIATTPNGYKLRLLGGLKSEIALFDHNFLLEEHFFTKKPSPSSTAYLHKNHIHNLHGKPATVIHSAPEIEEKHRTHSPVVNFHVNNAYRR